MRKYLVSNVVKSFSFDSAYEVGIFLWGRDLKEWSVYLLQEALPADLDSLTRLLQERERLAGVRPALTGDELLALQQTLDYTDGQEGKSQQGYFSSRSGWAGRQLADLIKREQAARKNKEISEP